MAILLTQRVRWLDGWRGAAVLCVLVAHFGGPYFLGRFGVDAFFVLSGLLISGVLLEARQPLPLFFWRRAVRILPAFWAFLLIVHLCDSMAGLVVPVRELSAELLFIRNYWPAEMSQWFDGTLPFQHLWSLCVEEQAYCWMALVAWMLRARPVAAAGFLLSCAAACVGFDLIYRFRPPDPAMPFSIRTECAALPMLLSAGIFRMSTQRGWRLPRQAGAVALGLAIFVAVTGSGRMTGYMMLTPTLLAVAINALHEGRGEPDSLVHRALAATWLQFLGRVSFSVYLWQQPLHTLYERGKLPGPGVIWLVVSVGLGVCMYFLVERPARRWLVARAPGRARKQLPQR